MLKYLGFSLQHVSAMSAPIYTADSVSLRTESMKWCKMMEIEGAAGGLTAEVAALLTPYGKERELLLYRMRCLSIATQIAVAVYMYVNVADILHYKGEINHVEYDVAVCDEQIDHVRESAALWPRPTVMQALASETMQASAESPGPVSFANRRHLQQKHRQR